MKYPIHLSIQKMLKDAGLDIKAWCQARSIYVEETETVLFVSDEEFYDFLVEYKDSLTPTIIVNLCNLEVSRYFNSLLYYTLNASNALDGIKRYQKFRHRIGPIDIEMKETEEQITLRFIGKQTGLALDGPLLFLEQTLLLNILGQGGGSITPWRVNKAKGGTIVNTNELVLAISDLQFPLLKENNYMARHLEKAMVPYYAQLMGRSQNFTKIVIEELLDGLSEHEYHVIQIAKRLGMSERSLQRHLQDEGINFKRVLKQVQQMMMKVYIDLNITSEEIAFLTGFPTIREFLKTFRAWFGVGVSAYKERD